MSGRVVVVTGASSGIGEATARAFGRAGDRVVLTARRAERLVQVAARLPEAHVIPADLTRSGDIMRLVRETLDRFGRIDVLVNNAGLGRYDWIERLTEDEIRQDLELNLIAPIVLARVVVPVMQAQRHGVIINVGSVAGRIAVPTMAIYNAAKFGLDGFSEALRRELLPQGIHVCILYLGGVAGTEFGQHRRVLPGVSTPRWLQLTPERVARAIVDLADRPRGRRVLPALFRVAMAVNGLLPVLIDVVVTRVIRRQLSDR